ncbi:isochorismatase family protein [Affinibrenneria salicis]|uniref:Isochorismatase family protein n=1 Tax=Affinibrenneria salicis TaxID=2590031 RepID=A0A5J5FUW8_9GAMM|nr:isochorismatase family protein [Affinibrenneria salicis]KAA8997345.1 isochorismatase family protein [Affinibrenneria salicis]
MSHSALLIIDVQHSFLHRPFWREDDVPAFQQALTRLINGCRQRGVALVDVFHVAAGPFALDSGYVTRLPFLTHRSDVVVHKRVHNALTDSGLEQWLRAKDIDHLIIAGMRTEQCCETTARVASDLGYRVTFVTEATLTFPMTYQNITLTPEQLKHRTETVLVDRFATLASVDECLAQCDSAPRRQTPSPARFVGQPWLPRPIDAAGVTSLNDWRLKRYTIRYRRAAQAVDFSAAWTMAAAILPTPAQTGARPGVGWVIEHQGKNADYLVLGWWDNANELRTRVWVTDHGQWRAARDESFCVWDLQVIAFERDAFVSHMLQNTPDPERYLARQLTICAD